MKSLSKKTIVASVITLIAVPSIAFGAWGYIHQTKKEATPVAATSINPIIYPEKKADTTAVETVVTPVAESPAAPIQAPAEQAKPKTISETIDSLTIEQIQQKTVTEACTKYSIRSYNFSITGEAWKEKIKYIMAQSDQTSYSYSNTDGQRFCKYYNTANDLMN